MVDGVLLESMMATVGVVWAIGFAAYFFIYQYFAERHLDLDRRVAYNPANAFPSIRDEVRRGLRRNLWVFIGFFAGNAVSAVTVGFCFSALSTQDDAVAAYAKALFAATVLVYTALFSFEIATSIGQVTDLWLKVHRP